MPSAFARIEQGAFGEDAYPTNTRTALTANLC